MFFIVGIITAFFSLLFISHKRKKRRGYIENIEFLKLEAEIYEQLKKDFIKKNPNNNVVGYTEKYLKLRARKQAVLLRLEKLKGNSDYIADHLTYQAELEKINKELAGDKIKVNDLNANNLGKIKDKLKTYITTAFESYHKGKKIPENTLQDKISQLQIEYLRHYKEIQKAKPKEQRSILMAQTWEFIKKKHIEIFETKEAVTEYFVNVLKKQLPNQKGYSALAHSVYADYLKNLEKSSKLYSTQDILNIREETMNAFVKKVKAEINRKSKALTNSNINTKRREISSAVEHSYLDSNPYAHHAPLEYLNNKTESLLNEYKIIYANKFNIHPKQDKRVLMNRAWIELTEKHSDIFDMKNIM